MQSSTNEFLIGSSVQPSNFVDPKGYHFSLGDVVREAFKRTAFTTEEWNTWDDESREEAIQEIVDEMKLEELS